jgi:hypothetical protein
MLMKALAVLRTVFLLFIVYFTVTSMPFAMDVPRTHDEQYARVAASASALQWACWYAIAWIAFETALGWWLALHPPRPPREPRRPAAPAPPAAPPAAPRPS